MKAKSHYFPAAALLISVACILLALVDLRRGFLFPAGAYLARTSFFVCSPFQLILLIIGVDGVLHFRRQASIPDRQLSNFTLFGLFVLLLIDAFLYRGVAAARALGAGKIGLDWLGAWGAEGLLKPLALSASYVLTVWHATVLSCLAAGLALIALPRLLQSHVQREGFTSTMAGTLYSLTQPFCSCCVSLTSPGLFRSRQSMSFACAVLLGAPLLNVSTLVLAGNLLPWPYAILRIVGGVAVTVILSYALAKMVRKVEFASDEHRLAEACPADSPADVVGSWLRLSGKIALLLFPAMVVGTLLSSLIWSFWPAQLGNSVSSVLFTSVVGSLVMVSTWSEIPLAAKMIREGMPGPAAAALIALPAVNLGSLLIIGHVSRNWRSAVGLGLGVMGVSAVAGLAFLNTI